MPTTSSVFGRLTGGNRQSRDIINIDVGADVAPPVESPERATRTRFLGGGGSGNNSNGGHKRESSILSLTNSVTDLGHNVRRSVSLRSHRPAHSASAIAPPKQRNPSSSSNLVTSPPLLSPVESSEEQWPVATSQSPPTPRSRGILSTSARSLSRRFKSTDTLPSLLKSERLDESGSTYSPSNGDPDDSTSGGMLAAPTSARRVASDRSTVVSQTSYSREGSVSHNGQNGATTQQAPTLPSTTTTGGSPGAVYQMIHETGAKRMATIEYMRKAHDGNIFYFGTLHFTSAGLATMPSMHYNKLGRRATSYLALGCSLPTLLDLNSGSALEYLKALSAVLQEFETYQNLSGLDTGSNSLSRGRVGQMFKSGMGLGNRVSKARRASATTDTFASDLPNPASGDATTSPHEDVSSSPVNTSGHDFQHLLVPHLPFDPDFSTTFATLCDVLVDTYARLLELVSGPEVCGPGVGDAFAKADKAVRKLLIASVVREFEDSTRAGMKSEVAGLGKLVLGGLV